ncbi:protein sex-lethal-like isoform X2 [Vespula maculifrons]|uniref:Protein sex-lethal-like isoform X2 n=1 Tax=Vespula maculifrons TaxID=7453 RepID=A0ABD2AWF5_VESMC
MEKSRELRHMHDKKNQTPTFFILNQHGYLGTTSCEINAHLSHVCFVLKDSRGEAGLSLWGYNGSRSLEKNKERRRREARTNIVMWHRRIAKKSGSTRKESSIVSKRKGSDMKGVRGQCPLWKGQLKHLHFLFDE